MAALNAPLHGEQSTVVRPRFRHTKWVAAVVVFLAAVCLFLWYVGVFGGNVHAVVPGKFYRCAQLTGINLRRVLEEDHIHTVIDLRGGSMHDPWYRSELEECKRLGVKHVDIPFSAVRMPPPQAMRDLLTAFDSDPYPLLVHCHGGADRTGLASALYLAIEQNVPLDVAQVKELTWHYGHFGFSTHPMDDFLALYRRTSHGTPLREWITRDYPGLYATLPASDKTPGSDVAPSGVAVPAAPNGT